MDIDELISIVTLKKLEDDKFEGHGKQFYADGETFDGYYKNNVRHGQGKYLYSNGDIFEGTQWHY